MPQEGIRTPDPIITNDVLYQLSYCGAALGKRDLRAFDRRWCLCQFERLWQYAGRTAIAGAKPPILALRAI